VDVVDKRGGVGGRITGGGLVGLTFANNKILPAPPQPRRPEVEPGKPSLSLRKGIHSRLCGPHPLQALIGPWNGPHTLLTNLMTLTVE